MISIKSFTLFSANILFIILWRENHQMYNHDIINKQKQGI